MADVRASLDLISLCSSLLLRPVRDEDWWVEVLRVVVAVAVVVIELVVAASVALVGLGARVSVYATCKSFCNQFQEKFVVNKIIF
jgi:hypothetical protein